MSMDVMNGVVSIASLRRDLNTQAIGAELYDRIRRLYPICRSITGKGLRDTLGLIGQEIDLETREVPSGTQAFDWIVPKEWRTRPLRFAGMINMGNLPTEGTVESRGAAGIARNPRPFPRKRGSDGFRNDAGALATD